MPCMGPSGKYSRKLAADLTEKLWPKLEKAYQNNGGIFLLIDFVERELRFLMGLVDHYGYDCQTYELNRYKYLTIGLLNGLLPEEKYTTQYQDFAAEGSRFNHSAFEKLSEESLRNQLADTFFLLDCEDF